MKHSNSIGLTCAAPPQKRPLIPGWAGAAVILLVLVGAFWLLRSNPPGGSWSQSYNPTGFWGLSTLLAALPLMVLLGAMAVLRTPAHLAALAGLLTATIVAVFLFHMPLRLAMTSVVYGAGYGLFPICWIILPVLYLYRLTVESGAFAAFQKSLTSITRDSRLQLLLIAFALGAFLEGASGFGTPVAVCAAILIGLGFNPIQAAGLALLADTAPVAFGSLGIPLTTLHAVTGLDIALLSRMTAVLLVPFCILVPFWMIWIYAGLKGMLEVWPPILAAGLTFSITQYLVAVYFGPELVDIAAALLTILVLAVFLRFWKPKRTVNAQLQEIDSAALQRNAPEPGAARKGWLPWMVLTLVLLLWGLPQIAHFLGAHTTLQFRVAGLHNVVHRMPPVVLRAAAEPAVFTFNWLAATGTASMIAAILAGFLMGVGPGSQIRLFAKAAYSIRYAVLTIATMLALGFVTRYCGLDATVGLAFARTGLLYPFFGTMIGWLGTASTGSDTSSNVLFGSLQTLTAQQIHVSPVLMSSANTTGGVMAKMIAAPSIVVASTATETYGQEGGILRYVFLHSLALGLLAGGFVFLLAYVRPFTALVPR